MQRQGQGVEKIICGLCMTTDRKFWFTFEGVPWRDEIDVSLCGQCYALMYEQEKPVLV